MSNKVAKSFPLSASRTYTAAFALRQRMLNFIQNIEYYMMFEVIERNWQIFINKMQKVGTQLPIMFIIVKKNGKLVMNHD